MRKTGNYRPEPVLALATGATRRVRGYSCDTTFDPRSMVRLLTARFFAALSRARWVCLVAHRRHRRVGVSRARPQSRQRPASLRRAMVVN